jgi:hypothetical protein
MRSRRRERQRILGLAALVLVGSVVGGWMLVGRSSGSPLGVSAQECIARPGTVRVAGDRISQYRVGDPPNRATYDLRDLRSTAFPYQTLYPVSIGTARRGRSVGTPATHVCVVGGTVLGQQPRGLTWQQVKGQFDGDGLRIDGRGWYIVDGLRVDNVEDGLAPFGDGVLARNLYFTFIRDDCIENDAIAGGHVVDSLFDGCFMGLSERPPKDFTPSAPPADETFTVDGVLLRLQPMPYETPDELGSGQLFKWSKWANRLVLRDCVFLVEQESSNGRDAMRFPQGTSAENVTLVWTGPGDYPGPLPSGVKLTRDRSVWDAARAAWLARHGYPVIDG